MLPLHTVGAVHYGKLRNIEDVVKDFSADMSKLPMGDPKELATVMYDKLKKNQEMWMKFMAIKYPDPGVMARTEDIDGKKIEDIDAFKDKAYQMYLICC